MQQLGPPSTLPRAGTGLTLARRVIAVALAVLWLPLLTVVLTTVLGRGAGRQDLATDLLLYLASVVVVAVVGGLAPGLLAAVASFLLVNWYLTPPFHTFDVERRDNLAALVVFVAVAALVSGTVDLAARQRVAAARTATEARLMTRFASSPPEDVTAESVLEQVQHLFGMRSVSLERVDGDASAARSLAHVGPPSMEAPAVTVEAGPGLRLVARGPSVFAEDRRLLAQLAATAARAHETRELAAQAARAEQLAEIDRLRAALLAAVSHDLRTPLAGVKAAVSSLRQADVSWTDDERAELLLTIEECADRLAGLIANLLAMTRLQAGALSVDLSSVALDEVVARALLHQPHQPVTVDVAETLPPALADPGLLERVVENLVDNACRHGLSERDVCVRAEAAAGILLLHVVDHGPGVPQESWDRMMAPFERLGRTAKDGTGLGLAIADGFVQAMGARLEPSRTPGGGLTMTVVLPRAPARQP